MKILDLLFPRQCLGCKKTGSYLCKDCKRKLLPHMEICPFCHRYSTNYATCVDCKMNKNNALDGILVPFSYSWFLKKIILKLKYYHKKDVVDFLIDRVVLAISVNNILNKKINFEWSMSGNWNVIITWIPSHWYRRYFIKWYNQSYLLAWKLAEKLWLNYKIFLKKNKNTKSQASLNREWRLKNLKNAFDFIWDEKDLAFLNSVKTIILIDDITTTGSTMNEVAKLIKNQYPKISVWWIVLGRKDR